MRIRLSPNPIWLVCLSGGEMWTRRTMCTEIQGEDGHLQAKETGLGQSLPSQPSEETSTTRTLTLTFKSTER